MIDSTEFRRVLGHYPTGVGVLTARPPGGRPCGLTVNSFCSVSLDPPLVLVCVDRAADSHACIVEAGHYVVNVLAEPRGEALARRFATWGIEDKFNGVAYHEQTTGAPVLDDALAWIECRIHVSHDAGDHSIFVGEVLAADAAEGTPLLFYRGGYGRFIS